MKGDNDNGDIVRVTYGVTGTAYTARKCRVVQNVPSTNSIIQCTTAPGVGKELRFLVNIGGQTSLLSSAYTAATTATTVPASTATATVGTAASILMNEAANVAEQTATTATTVATTSLTTLSYRSPSILSIDPATSITADNIQVTVTGDNFGPSGTLVGVTFGESHSNPFGDSAVSTTHVSHDKVLFNVPVGTVNTGHLIQVHVTDTSAALLVREP